MEKGEPTGGIGERVAFILFTDIYQSTRLWEKYPKDFEEALERHNAIVEQTVLAHSGEIMKNLGDGYIAIFDTADECVRSGVEVQRKVRTVGQLPDGTEMLVRVVIHSGLLRRLAAGRGYFGEPLNRASRICQVCQPGQLLLSQAVRQPIRQLPDSTRIQDLGMHHLRDLAEPERLFQLDHPDFARHEFPPLPTLGYRPNNLVAQPNAFIGRERELKELCGIISSRKHRLTTICAPGGYGKSRLATQLCADLLDEFENGAFEVLLTPVSEPRQIISVTADALGLQFHGSQPPEDQLLNYLHGKELLLLFDNFEHVAEGKSLLIDIIQRAPRVSLMATSREPLRLKGEKVYTIDPLSVSQADSPDDGLPDGVRLFVERASLVKTDFELSEATLPIIRGICEKLEGVPLAIELAAAWSDFYPLPTILKSVEQQLDITARMTDLPERHGSVRASLDHSYRLLDGETAQALHALAVFPGSFSLEAALNVLNSPRGHDNISALHTKSWIYACPKGDEARFSMRGAQHDYAVEKIAVDENRAKYFSRHANYYADLLESECCRLTGPEQLSAITGLALDLPNIHSALGFAVEKAELELLGRFAQHLRCYFEYGSHYAQGEDYYQRLLATLFRIADGNTHKRAMMFTRLGLGIFQWRLGKAAEAQTQLARAKLLAEELADEIALALIISAIANVNIRGAQYAEAEKLNRQAIDLRRKHNELPGLAHSYNGLGLALFFQGQPEGAEECYRTCLEITRSIGDLRGTARTLNNLGILLSRRGRTAEASSLFQECVEIARQIGATDIVSIAINNLGNIALNENDFEKARKWFMESLSVSRDIGHLHEVAGALNNLAELSTKEGKYEEARTHLAQSLAVSEKLSEPVVLLEAVVRTAILLSLTGAGETARSLLTEALTAADSLGKALSPRTREEASGILAKMPASAAPQASPAKDMPAYLSSLVSRAAKALQA